MPLVYILYNTTPSHLDIQETIDHFFHCASLHLAKDQWTIISKSEVSIPLPWWRATFLSKYDQLWVEIMKTLGSRFTNN